MKKTIRIPENLQYVFEELEKLGIPFSKYINLLIEKDNMESVVELQQRSVYSDEWYTPKYVIDYWKEKGWNFTLDVSTTKEQLNYLEIKKGYTISDNSLDKVWDANGGDIWLNPPFSKTKQFLSKARRVFDENPNQRIMILLPFSPDSSAWKEYINGKSRIYIPSNRITFFNEKKENITFGGQTKIVFVEMTDYECNDIQIIDI